MRAGAKLSDKDKETLWGINAELAALGTAFRQNVLKETNASAIFVADRAELEGIPENEIAGAALAAKQEGKTGYLIRLQNTTGHPLLNVLKNRALRQRILEASLARNSRGGEFDNREVVSRTARLRAQRAALLGYPTFAAYSLEEQTARTVPAVNQMLADIAPKAVSNARREAADLQSVIDAEKGGFKLAAWDWDFYSEKVRKERYCLTSRSCGRIWNSTTCFRTGCSMPRENCTESRSKSVTIFRSICRRCASLRSSTKTASRLRCLWLTIMSVLQRMAARGPTPMYVNRGCWANGR